MVNRSLFLFVLTSVYCISYYCYCSNIFLLLFQRGTINGIYMKEQKEKFLEIIVTIPQNGQNSYTTTFSLGVTFPNGTISDPIENQYLSSKPKVL